MGLFSKKEKEKCPICGKELTFFSKTLIADGAICDDCTKMLRGQFDIESYWVERYDGTYRQKFDDPLAASQLFGPNNAHLSLLASANPDGLEWALFGNEEEGYAANMGLDEENFGVSSDIADKAGSIQEATSFLPDYAFPDSESPAGTTVSGIVGSAIVAGVAVLICLAGGFFRKKKTKTA